MGRFAGRTVGLLYVLLVSDRLLPGRDAAIDPGEDPRRYTAEVRVAPGGPMVGKSIERRACATCPGCSWRKLSAAFDPPGRGQRGAQADDGLVFVGVVDSVTDLHRMPGIVPATNQVFKLKAPREQALPGGSGRFARVPLVGRSIREGRFRIGMRRRCWRWARRRPADRQTGRYCAPGGRHTPAGEPRLLSERYGNSRHFYLVSSIDNPAPP